jgi:hypothetical protein
MGAIWPPAGAHFGANAKARPGRVLADLMCVIAEDAA